MFLKVKVSSREPRRINKLDFVSLASGGGTGERSSSGLLEWESINDAMEALAMMNHYQMKNPSEFPSILSFVQGVKCCMSNQCCLSLFSPDGPYPYTLKLCFSTAQHAN